MNVLVTSSRMPFALDEIRDILSVQQTGEPPCGQVLDLIDMKISLIDQRIAELQVFRAELATLRTTRTQTMGRWLRSLTAHR